MKVLSLIQPWATLIALEEKFVETRSWKTKFRGRIGIHASQKIDYAAYEIPEIKKALLKHGITDPDQLPTGAIIATTNIFDCAEMVGVENPHNCKVKGYRISEKEYAFGDYRPGRYGWMLSCTKQLPRPVPAKGKLMLWEYDGELPA